jgi:uncharacterized membrane protein YhaH (DUF805 family)
MDSIFSLEGRLNRGRYFGRMLAIAILTQIVAFLAGLFLGATMGNDAQQTASVIGGIIGLVGTVVMAFQVVKRLHDLGRPGTHYWLLLIPFYNIYLALMLLFKKGEERVNQYGEDPLAVRSQSVVAGS